MNHADLHDEFVQSAIERLRAAGWHVDVTSRASSVNLRLEHPLSSGRTLVYMHSSEIELSDFIERALTNREFALVAARPNAMPHAQLVGAIREAAQVGGWGPDTVSLIADVLARHDVITDDEASWLEEAGPAWASD